MFEALRRRFGWTSGDGRGQANQGVDAIPGLTRRAVSTMSSQCYAELNQGRNPLALFLDARWELWGGTPPLSADCPPVGPLLAHEDHVKMEWDKTQTGLEFCDGLSLDVMEGGEATTLRIISSAHEGFVVDSLVGPGGLWLSNKNLRAGSNLVIGFFRLSLTGAIR